MNKSPGVVVVTKFCKAGSSKFQKYVDYMNRDEAVRLENENQFNLYADYMGDSEKTTGLFTKQKDVLSKEEKNALKKGFEMAQKNGSLMWQTVISFDNQWLDENGLYDCKSGRLDEKKLKEVTRNAVGKMLENEKMENALWSAAIHLNTDNIHIHVATVEPIPMRQKKEYIQYQTLEKNGKEYKEPILKPDGNPLMKEEYVGRFKGKSIEKCKSSVVNQILKEQDANININRIIRGSILQGVKENPLMKDAAFRKKLLKLYSKLPDVDRKMWNYNTSIMQPFQNEIDELTTHYIYSYHKDEFEELKKEMGKQEEQYMRAYGGKDEGNRYSENKMKDLYARMGNSILKELRAYDKELKRNNIDREMSTGKKYEDVKSNNTVRTRSAWLLSSSLKRLKKSMEKDWQQIQNEREHEALMEKNNSQYVDR